MKTTNRYSSRHYCLIIFILFTSIITARSQTAENDDSTKIHLDRAHALYESGEHDEAIKLLEKGLNSDPKHRIWYINLMHLILSETENYDALAKVAIERAGFFENSPKKSREVVLAYIKAKDYEKAIEWLIITKDRGYQDYSDLNNNPIFDPLRNYLTFIEITENIKKEIGIDERAKSIEGIDIAGDTVILDDFLGKVILIDFWAVYCKPCLVEINNLKQYYPDLNKKGFEIISVNLDEDRNKVLKYINQKSISWPILFSGLGWADENRVRYDLVNIPSYWLIDKSGVLRYTGLAGKELEIAIKALISEPVIKIDD